MNRVQVLLAGLGVAAVMVIGVACGSGESSPTRDTSSSATFFENASGNTVAPVEPDTESAISWFSLIAAVSVGLGVLGTIFWVWMLVDCATKEPEEGNSKVVWTIIIVFTHLVGAAIYFFVRRPQRRAEADGC